jgi:hypothetical protein
MENRYEAGAVITAKENPAQKLVINRYYHRIYYCYKDGDQTKKLLAYFEHELLPPVAAK